MSKVGHFVPQERDSRVPPKSLINQSCDSSVDPDIDIIITMPHKPTFASDDTSSNTLLDITKEYAKTGTVVFPRHPPCVTFFQQGSNNDTGLPYYPPTPGALVNTAGRRWDYQASPDLTKLLHDQVEEHFRNYKNTIPLYLFLSGAGTGKSRNATELDKTIYKCFDGTLKRMSFWHHMFTIHSFSM